MVGAAAGSIIVPDARIAIPLAAIAIALLAWTARALLRNPHMPIAQRLFMAAYLGLFVFMLLARIMVAIYVVTR